MRTIAIEEHFSLPQEHQRLTEMMNAPDCSPTTSVTVGAALAVFKKMIDLREGRLADMDAAGIDMQIIQLTGAYLDQLDKQALTSLCRESNDILSQAVRSHPDRFAGFAQLPMKDPEAAVKELERCVSKLGFKAAVWSGMANGQFLDHPSFFPVLAEAERLNVPIYIHPAPPSKEVFDNCYSGLGEASGIFALAGWGMHMESGTHSFRLILSGLFDRLPELQIITGHVGEGVPYNLDRADEFMSYGPYCKLKLERRVGDYYRNNFYFSTSGYYSQAPLLCAVSVVGSDRIILGTDYPYGDSARTTKQINAALLSQDDIANISYRNAEKLFKLKPAESKNEISVPVLTPA